MSEWTNAYIDKAKSNCWLLWCLHLELVWLQFALSGFGGEGWHVVADGGQSFGVGVEHDGRDQAVGCAHCHTHVHHMIPGGWKSTLMPAGGGYRVLCLPSSD